MFREPSVGRYYEEEPQIVGQDVRSWITRAANFAVICNVGEAGAMLSGTARDEQFVYALEGGVAVSGGGENATLEVEDLAILPPGEWTIRFDRPGHVVQIVTASEDLAELAANQALYADGALEVTPITPSAEPLGGYRLRRYSTLEGYALGGHVHAYRTCKLMIVPYPRFLKPRDETQLTPHSHEGFEQASVALEGGWVHFLRVPWTANRADWRPDVELEVESPSTTIMPAGVIHTSQGLGGGGMRLIDVFAPPRTDFIERGVVDNADDYRAADAVTS